MQRKNESIIETAFQDIGIRARKYIAPHILLEHAYDSNLVSDISKVDYLEDNQGQTHLQPLDGLPTFVEDLYVYGYLEKKECVFARGKNMVYNWRGKIGKKYRSKDIVLVTQSCRLQIYQHSYSPHTID